MDGIGLQATLLRSISPLFVLFVLTLFEAAENGMFWGVRYYQNGNVACN